MVRSWHRKRWNGSGRRRRRLKPLSRRESARRKSCCKNGKAEAAAKEKRLTQEAIERGQEQIRKAEQEAKAVLSRADANAAKAIR